MAASGQVSPRSSSWQGVPRGYPPRERKHWVLSHTRGSGGLSFLPLPSRLRGTKATPAFARLRALPSGRALPSLSPGSPGPRAPDSWHKRGVGLPSVTVCLRLPWGSMTVIMIMTVTTMTRGHNGFQQWVLSLCQASAECNSSSIRPHNPAREPHCLPRLSKEETEAGHCLPKDKLQTLAGPGLPAAASVPWRVGGHQAAGLREGRGFAGAGHGVGAWHTGAAAVHPRGWEGAFPFLSTSGVPDGLPAPWRWWLPGD